MATVRRLYRRVDQWARDLSQPRYAVLLGASSAIGVLTIGLLISEDVLLVQALTIGVVMFTLEAAFGKFQAAEE